MDTLLSLAFSTLLTGASAFVCTYFVRQAFKAFLPKVEETFAFRLALRALAVLFGVGLGACAHGLFPDSLSPLAATLLGGLSGFGARDAYDAYKGLRKGAVEAAKKRVVGAIEGKGEA